MPKEGQCVELSVSLRDICVSLDVLCVTHCFTLEIMPWSLRRVVHVIHEYVHRARSLRSSSTYRLFR